ncbi:MAG: PDZ domain-containing protein [Acidimicrobiia bacterium]|nr:PDZ domain-containing protein [Acidimicrobiia bacterium]
MDSPTEVVDPHDSFESVPPSLRPPSTYPKWPFYLAGFLVVIGIAIGILLTVTVPYYAVSPGPVYDTSDFVTVEGGNTADTGELFFLTVSLKEANVFEWAAAQFDERVELAKVGAYRPPDVSEEQLRRESLALMDQSKQDATYVALTKLGYEVTLIGTGALVIDTIPGSAADGVLQPNDIIVEMDGKTVAFRSDVLSLLAPKSVGDPVVVTVERSDGETDGFEVDDFEIVLGPHTDDPTKPMMGVLLDNNEPIVEFPVKVDIDSLNVGGPSAGLMFTLQIMDQLTPEPLTHGMRIAGTGTIHLDETVGAIGGIRQKVFGAIDAGAVAILVPAGNYDDAVAAAGDRIKVVRVETVDDALDFLNTL